MEYGMYMMLLIVLPIQIGRCQVIIENFTVVNIHEDTQSEEDIAPVICQDNTAGAGDCAVCNILRSKPPNAPFKVWRKDINANNAFHVYYVGGYATNGLDYYNVATTYILTIVCSTANLTFNTTADLEVDVNPNLPPYVTNWNGNDLTLDARTPVLRNTVLDTVTAQDAESDPITYIMWTKPRVDYFSIGAYDGIIRSEKDLRSAVEGVVEIMVNVTDGRRTRGIYHRTIRITELNQRPTFTNLPVNVSVYEDATTWSYPLLYTDTNMYPFTMSPVCTVFPSHESYKFSFTQNKIILASATTEKGNILDYEKNRYYNISCVINDGYLDSVGGYINFNVINVNEPPVFGDQLYYCVMDENYQYKGPCDLSGITVTDPENDNIIEYRLNGINSGLFRYDHASSELAFNIDYDVDKPTMPTSVLLTLIAVDVHLAKGSTSIQVNIRDVNDNDPSFGTQVNFYTITQGDPVGPLPFNYNLLLVSDNDLTAPNNVVELCSAGGIFNNHITVLDNGQIVYSTEFGPDDDGTSQIVYLKAEDGGTPTRSATGTVIVSFRTTTTTTTPTPTTNAPTTTPTTTTTTAEPGFFDYTENVVLFSALMVILFILLLGLLYLGLKYCSGGALLGGTGGIGQGGSLCPGLGGENGSCDDCFRPSQPNRVQNIRHQQFPNTRQPSPTFNKDYKDPFWNPSDHYEDGVVRPYL